MNVFWRVQFRLYRILSWLQYKLTRRFTPTGLLLIAALFISGGMGVDMESTVAYQASMMIIFLLIISMSFGWFFRSKFSALRNLPRFGTVGKTFEYAVTIQNRTPRVQRGLVFNEDLTDLRPKYPEWLAMQLAEQKMIKSLQFSRRRRRRPFKMATIKEAAIPTLKPNGEVEVKMEVTPLRRGVLRYEGITVARPDPFGMFRALARFPLPEATLILPKRYPLPAIALPGMMKYQEGGVAQASNVGQSEEFIALRDYRRGDPVRHIHWRSWAKTGTPIVKEFADEFFVRHALVLDTFSEHPHGDAFEEAVSIAASFACSIQTQESLLDLLFVGAEAYCFTAGRGLAHADQILEILASVKVCADKPFRSLETLVLNHADTVSGCICILLQWDETRQEFVRKLKASGVPVLVMVVLAVAPEKPLERGPMRDDPAQFHTLVLGQIEEGLAKL